MPQHAPGFAIENREQLINLLAEAAEIEHNLMCCYLYAAFSLKDSAEEDLTPEELDAVRRWRREILHVAIDEMGHLALVANIASAVGGVPHFDRPNFPIASGYHPAGIVVKLAPFDYETLQHFIFLERPEGSQDRDGAGFEPPRHYVREAWPNRLMPSSGDYDTVGALYRCIRAGLTQLTQQKGADALFIGDPSRQLGPDLANLPCLSRVLCLRTAQEALDGIVTQGEGASDEEEESHYHRFLRVQREFDELLGRRPAFRPGRLAAHNPLMRRPADPDGKVWIELQPAADLLDLVNATYTLMLRFLVQGYAETRGLKAQRVLVDAAVDLMFAISPVASHLTTLPANSQRPDITAGMSFAMNRVVAATPADAVTDCVLIERCDEIAAAAARLLPAGSSLASTAASLLKIRNRVAEGLATMTSITPGPAPVAAMPVQPVPAPGERTATGIPVPTVVNGVEFVPGNALTLIYEGKRCIHARHCVLGAPKVFKANVQGPWIDPDAVSTEQLVTIAHMCPSGAIRYERKDGGENERPPPVNLVQLRENGPLGMRGDLKIDGVSIGYRATLCRCGESKNKPFCDGSHNAAGFTASGEPATRPSEPLAQRDGVVDVRPQRNGPLAIRGSLEICAGTGRTVDRVTDTRLCRCGHSASKPFCDGSHVRVGFQAD